MIDSLQNIILSFDFIMYFQHSFYSHDAVKIGGNRQDQLFGCSIAQRAKPKGAPYHPSD